MTCRVRDADRNVSQANFFVLTLAKPFSFFCYDLILTATACAHVLGATPKLLRTALFLFVHMHPVFNMILLFNMEKEEKRGRISAYHILSRPFSMRFRWLLPAPLNCFCIGGTPNRNQHDLPPLRHLTVLTYKRREKKRRGEPSFHSLTNFVTSGTASPDTIHLLAQAVTSPDGVSPARVPRPRWTS